ncbi:hypothetical protein LN650_02955 [Klebsiella pneumoniae subsp. pneumoniae]|nr:hypothetical protein [Klebsiella pneumoniae subsp. pneumoniae]
MMPDGRIIDTAKWQCVAYGRSGLRHALAVANNESSGVRQAAWQWTDNTLRNKSNGLFYWRYNPVAPDPIADKKQRLRWRYPDRLAPLRAQKQWQDKRYAIASDAITAALLKSTVVTFAGRQVMLPGVKGFNLNDRLNLNPSYFIFPAWRAFAERTHLTALADIARATDRRCWGRWAGGNLIYPATGWRCGRMARCCQPKSGRRG